MGDNRYYTFIQFYSVIFLTVTGAAALFSGVYRSVRNGRDPGLFWVMSGMLFFAFGAVARIVEWVVPDFGIAAYWREVFLWTVILGVLCIVAYRGRWMIGGGFDFLTEGYRRWFVIAAMLIMIICLPNFIGLVKTYAYPVVTYSLAFKTGFTALTVLYAGQAATRHVHWLKVHRIRNRQRELASISGALYGGSLIFYLWRIPISPYRDAAEYLLVFFGVLVIHLMVEGKNSFGITSAAFDNVVRFLPEYIVVTDMVGTVIYSNRASGKYRHFRSVRTLTEGDFDHLMGGKTEIKENRDGRFYIQVKNQDAFMYYLYKKTLVGTEGILYSFLDMTELIGMLSDLEALQKEMEALNSQLKDEKAMTYRLEQEKEVNTLLEEVTQIQEASMMALVESIEGLSKKGKLFYKEIDEAIKSTNDILTEVRKAVRTYRKHYGG